MFILDYISNTIMDFLYVILHHSNKIVKFKELKMVPKYQFSSAPALKRFYRSQLTKAHISETLRKNVFLFSMLSLGALKETQKLCAICLVRVSGCRKLEWVNVNDFMGNGR